MTEILLTPEIFFTLLTDVCCCIDRFSFFRRLDVGSDGPDVLQLEAILSASGYDVGTVDQLFTEETRSGLRDWQIARGYGGASQNPTKILLSL